MSKNDLYIKKILKMQNSNSLIYETNLMLGYYFFGHSEKNAISIDFCTLHLGVKINNTYLLLITFIDNGQ